MPYPRDQLLDSEEVIFEIRPHWWYLVPRFALLAVAVVAGIAVATKQDDGGGWRALGVIVGVGLIAALIFFLLRLARWLTTEFTLTTERVVYRHGVLRKQGIETGLDRIDTVVFHQRLFERIIGAGDLVLEHAGQTENRFTDIRKPGVVQSEINKQKELNENRKYDRMGRGGGSGGGGGGGGSKADELAKLDDLRSRGVLSEEEFQQQKAELLGG